MRRLAVLPLLFCVGGCEGVQTMLGGQGAESDTFIRLFAVFLGACTVQRDEHEPLTGGRRKLAGCRLPRQAEGGDCENNGGSGEVVGPHAAGTTLAAGTGRIREALGTIL